MKISQADVLKYGFSESCRACQRVRGGLPTTGIPHSAECRGRLTDCIRQAPGDEEWLRKHEEGLQRAKQAGSAPLATEPPVAEVPVAEENTEENEEEQPGLRGPGEHAS